MAVEDTIKQDSPFDLHDDAAYQTWKQRKLDGYPRKAEELLIEINDPMNLTTAEHEAILECCNKANMVIYASRTGTDPRKEIPATLGAQLGLRNLDRNMGADDDGITALRVVDQQWRDRYIPYSDRPIHWHTDGYYNGMDQQIHSLLLHCVRPAREGGENALLDHEIAYIRLRDKDPAYIKALMEPDVMTIPANIQGNSIIRPSRSGPVFSVGWNGRLHMRYTARTHNILWKSDPQTEKAVIALENLLASAEPYTYRLTLQPGWGLISNNVLHDRSGFSDDKDEPRLLYRLRYYEAIS